MNRKYKSTIENLISNASIGYEVIKGLNVKSSFGFTSMNVNEVSTIPISAFDPQYYVFVTGASQYDHSVKGSPSYKAGYLFGKIITIILIAGVVALIIILISKATRRNRTDLSVRQ